MAKQSIFSRITQLARADINAMIDSSEEPQKIIDRMIDDYSVNIIEAEKAMAQTTCNLRLLQEDCQVNAAAAESWNQKAIAATKKAEESLVHKDVDSAQKFEDLAKIAIQRQIKAENAAQSIAPTIKAQEEAVNKLKSSLEQVKLKLSSLHDKREQIVARSETAQAQNIAHGTAGSADLADSSNEIDRFEERIRREEARMSSAQELASSSLESQFAALEDTEQRAEVEARLAALKSRHTVKDPAALESEPYAARDACQEDAMEDTAAFEFGNDLSVDYDIEEEPEQ